ncbi:hypothetical protein R1flu_002167 [Riccia fluitans]|uniref:Uncharacterized protein n=1 Tax=Riccia fluitans TaxID=41844 RepID=A0ABD1Y8P3_9MARC
MKVKKERRRGVEEYRSGIRAAGKTGSGPKYRTTVEKTGVRRTEISSFIGQGYRISKSDKRQPGTRRSYSRQRLPVSGNVYVEIVQPSVPPIRCLNFPVTPRRRAGPSCVSNSSAHSSERLIQPHFGIFNLRFQGPTSIGSVGDAITGGDGVHIQDLIDEAVRNEVLFDTVNENQVSPRRETRPVVGIVVGEEHTSSELAHARKEMEEVFETWA